MQKKRGSIGKWKRYNTDCVKESICQTYRRWNVLLKNFKIGTGCCCRHSNNETPEMQFFKQYNIVFKMQMHQLSSCIQSKQKHTQHFRNTIGIQQVRPAVRPSGSLPVAPLLPAASLFKQIRSISIVGLCCLFFFPWWNIPARFLMPFFLVVLISPMGFSPLLATSIFFIFYNLKE